MSLSISDTRVIIRGGGDLSSGVAWRLHQCGFRVLITEIPEPLSVRRKVSFCEAVFDGATEVEGVRATLADSAEKALDVWKRGEIPVMVDPQCEIRHALKPRVLVDAILAKRNLGTSIEDAPVVIGVGPGFEVGKDCHGVVETNRGHCLGRFLVSGSAEPNTGVPGSVMGITTDRVLRSPADGIFELSRDIGAPVKPGDILGSVSGLGVEAVIAGVLRGIIRHGVTVSKGMKIGDIDPRARQRDSFTISDKALAVAGGVLEGILRFHR